MKKDLSTRLQSHMVDVRKKHSGIKSPWDSENYGKRDVNLVIEGLENIFEKHETILPNRKKLRISIAKTYDSSIETYLSLLGGLCGYILCESTFSQVANQDETNQPYNQTDEGKFMFKQLKEEVKNMLYYK